MARVTVVIPTYNRMPLIKQSVSSVLDQTFEDFDLIVVDDGSTDNTAQAVRSIADKRLRYVFKENGGCASARNRGYEEVRDDCEYICNLDSDDFWDSNFLETMVRNMDKYPDVGVAYSSRMLLYDDGTRIDDTPKVPPKNGWVTKELFLDKSSVPVHTSGTCFRRSAIDGTRYEEALRNAADFDYWLRISKWVKFLFIPDCYIFFRYDHAVTPRTAKSRLNAARARILERFYFRLGGDDILPRSKAFKRISHAYRSAGKKHYALGHRSAAMQLFAKAWKYYPRDVRLLTDVCKSFFLSPARDTNPEWQLPPPLPSTDHGK